MLLQDGPLLLLMLLQGRPLLLLLQITQLLRE